MVIRRSQDFVDLLPIAGILVPSLRLFLAFELAWDRRAKLLRDGENVRVVWRVTLVILAKDMFGAALIVRCLDVDICRDVRIEATCGIVHHI